MILVSYQIVVNILEKNVMEWEKQWNDSLEE